VSVVRSCWHLRSHFHIKERRRLDVDVAICDLYFISIISEVRHHGQHFQHGILTSVLVISLDVMDGGSGSVQCVIEPRDLV